jgi:hypothetical protein
MKDLGPTMAGRLQEMGSLLMRGNRATEDSFLTGRMRQRRPEPGRPHHHAEFGVCSVRPRTPPSTSRATPGTGYTTLGSAAGTGGDGGRRRAAAVARHRWRRLDPHPAGANGNIGLKPSRGVLSIAPKLSDLTGLVSTQGCQSRTVRDTAAFVDHCRGGAPGEFMPYWMPAEPYTAADPARPGPSAHRAVARVGRLPRHAALRVRARARGPLPGRPGPPGRLGAARHRLPRGVRAQTTCYISNFAQTICQPAGPHAGWTARRRADRADQHPHLGGRPAHFASPSGRMQAVFNTTARGFGNFFEDPGTSS